MKIKRRKADILYSQWLRKIRPSCEACGGNQTLQVSHFFGRANENLRFNPLNTDCLCFSCHQYFTANPNEYVSWKRLRMGEKEYNKLVLESNIKKKRDDKLTEMWLQRELNIGVDEKKEKECTHRLKQCTMCHLTKKKKK